MAAQGAEQLVQTVWLACEKVDPAIQGVIVAPPGQAEPAGHCEHNLSWVTVQALDS